MATILITGGSGLIGTALTTALLAEGHLVRYMSRKAGKYNGIVAYGWDIQKGTMDPNALNGVDHIVHLAGAGIADKRWSDSRIKELINSRTGSADLLLGAVKEGALPIKSFVSASGIGYYGAVTSDHIYTENDAPGTDTIARITVAWEHAVDRWESICRVVKLRTPIVLARNGGALEKLTTPIGWGLGSPIGTGRQWVPWVHIHDLVGIYQQALFNVNMNGAYNVNTGKDVTNAELMRTAAHILRKPYFLPAVPAFALRIVLGDLSSVLLQGSRASNGKLVSAGYQFQHSAIRPALQDLLERAAVTAQR